jgi:prepilin-type N-terminal cleavage/methylation domain-containing protein
MDNQKRNIGRAGFTLIEVMVSLVIFSLVMVTVYDIYNNSAKAFFSQENAVQMNQEARTTLELMTYEIRMAGYNGTGEPTQPSAVDLGFLHDAGNDDLDTDKTSIHFTMDTTGGEGTTADEDSDGRSGSADNAESDGWIGDNDAVYTDNNEDVAYYLSGTSLWRRTFDPRVGAASSDARVVLENVTDLTFRYFSGEVDAAGDPVELLDFPLDENDRADVRSVEIALTVDSHKKDPLSKQLRNTTLVQRIQVRNAGLSAALVGG